MAIMRSKDGKDLIVDCNCGCCKGLRFRVEEDHDYIFMSCIDGNYYRDQSDKLWCVIYRKLAKIWCIIRNKDFYYSDIMMSKDEFNEFKNYIMSIELRK